MNEKNPVLGTAQIFGHKRAKDLRFPLPAQVHYGGRYCPIIGQTETPEGRALIAGRGVPIGNKKTMQVILIQPNDQVEVLPI